MTAEKQAQSDDGSSSRGSDACVCTPVLSASCSHDAGWNRRYWLKAIALGFIWGAAYGIIQPLANDIVNLLPGIEPNSHLGEALAFFIYDTAKILLLLVALIYVLALVRASLNVERVRDFLAGKRRGLGYFLGAMFGSITPFCSCSSIPLFLGFTAARIPFGITMSFLITSPLINEIAIVLLWGLLGWKFTAVYVLTGMAAGISGGFFMDAIKAERWLQPYMLEIVRNPPDFQTSEMHSQKLTLCQRHNFAASEMRSIFKRVWKWVILGVGVGAALHGFVPDNWFADNLGAGEWWTVPLAVLVAIPLYSNVTGIVPVMESLLLKGLPVGTTMAFCMSAVAASIPEVILLRQIMTVRLQAVFLAYLWVVFTLTGWLYNFIGPGLVSISGM